MNINMKISEQPSFEKFSVRPNDSTEVGNASDSFDDLLQCHIPTHLRNQISTVINDLKKRQAEKKLSKVFAVEKRPSSFSGRVELSVYLASVS